VLDERGLGMGKGGLRTTKFVGGFCEGDGEAAGAGGL
jgi:hypothetical protein